MFFGWIFFYVVCFIFFYLFYLFQEKWILVFKYFSESSDDIDLYSLVFDLEDFEFISSVLVDFLIWMSFNIFFSEDFKIR